MPPAEVCDASFIAWIDKELQNDAGLLMYFTNPVDQEVGSVLSLQSTAM